MTKDDESKQAKKNAVVDAAILRERAKQTREFGEELDRLRDLVRSLGGTP